jgi:probable rRNA maturation factor
MPRSVSEQSVTVPEGDARASVDAEPHIGLSVDVVHEAGDWPQLDALIIAVSAAAEALAAELQISGQSACVALSSDAAIAILNAAYRDKKAPTNVLSFPAPVSGKGDASFLGDIGLAAETVAREAREQGVPLVDHLQHLIVHGLLHLQGYDHQTEAGAEAMEALEVRILARLGVADPPRKATARTRPERPLLRPARAPKA